MKIYKLRHKKTGLFFTPSRGSGNLSLKGKVYDRLPSLSWCTFIRVKFNSYRKTKMSDICSDVFNIPKDKGFVDQYIRTSYSDWEIVEL